MKEKLKGLKEYLIKKLGRKGFTLIELLAVIVILAIVLVVTIPNVIGSINSAKEKQFENAIKIVEDYMTTQYALCKSGLGEFNNNYDSNLFVDNCKIDPENGSNYILKASNTSNDIIERIYDYRIENEKFKIGFAFPGNGVKDNNDKLLINHITSLYDVTSKSEVISNSITYHYANIYNDNGGLMNDRRGGTIGIDDGNIRYYGADPNNYIYFNCTDYSNQKDSTCEKWRIIGIVDGKVKIIRNDSIGNYSWDTSAETINSGNGINQWGKSTYTTGEEYEGADLMKLLNPGYEDNKKDGIDTLANNSLYYNRQNGTCFSGSSNATAGCNFATSGITNTTKGLISDAVWYLGGFNITTTLPNIYADYAYVKEHGAYINAPDEGVIRTKLWVGKIGLIYVSDYGYAVDLSKCGDYGINNYSSCSNENWLKSTLSAQSQSSWYSWTMSVYPYPNKGYFSWAINDGNAKAGGTANSIYIYPTTYLNLSVIISDGDGTLNNPYQILTG